MEHKREQKDNRKPDRIERPPVSNSETNIFQ
jgi:hypothetical protein